MKNLIKLAHFALYILLTCVILVGCTENKQVEPQHNYKYTIWVGSSTLSVGYKTDAYKDSCGYFIFMKPDSTTSIYPKDRIMSIDINAR